MDSDWELVKAYGERREETAFREIVRRHVDMVYGAARRMLGGPGQEAEDVTQAVFLLLAQRAGRISKRGALAGWLYRATRFCCANVRKEAGRRRRREREAAMRDVTVEQAAEDLAPVLDAALERLGEKERQAVLVRYLEGKTAGETGAALGISEAAAEKRVERGVEKLRRYFAQRGYVVPAGVVVGVMSAEVKAAPARLAEMVARRSVPSGTVKALATGVNRMMTMASVKIVGAAVAAAVVLAGGAAVGVMGVHNTARTAGIGKVGQGEHVMFVRWDEVVRDEGAARVIAAGTVKPTGSVGYTVVEAEADKVRAALRDAAGRGELLSLAVDNLAWASMDQGTPPAGQPDFNIVAHGLNNHVRFDDRTDIAVTAGMDDNAVLDPRGDRVRVQMAGTLRETQLLGQETVRKNLMMAYTGEVPVDHAVVFVGDLGKENGAELYHVSVWETFACSDAEFAYMRRASEAAWRERGVAAIKGEAERAVAWEAHGHSSEEVKPQWQQVLANGARVKMVAVTDRAKWPGCWWDAEGRAVKTPVEWRNWNIHGKEEGVSAAIDVEDPSAPDEEGRGITMTDATTGSSREGVAVVEVKEGVVSMGVAAGPWVDQGAIAMGEMRTVEGIKVRVKSVQRVWTKQGPRQAMSYVNWEASDNPDVELRVVVMDKGGKEMHEVWPPGVAESRDQFGWKDPHDRMENVEGDTDDMGKFVVKTRRRVWTEMRGIAMQPVSDPGGMIVAAAVEKAAPATAAAPSTQVSEDQSSPEGVMRMFKAAIARHDAAGARALMLTKSPEEAAMAEGMVAGLVASDELHAAAAKRFGEAATEEALVRAGFALKVHEIPDMVWKIDGNTATQVSTRKDVRMVVGGPGSTLKRVEGKWLIDMSLPAEMTAEEKKRVPQYVEVERMQAGLEGGVAKEVEAGKYKDVYEARDALNAGMEKVRKKAEGL